MGLRWVLNWISCRYMGLNVIFRSIKLNKSLRRWERCVFISKSSYFRAPWPYNSVIYSVRRLAIAWEIGLKGIESTLNREKVGNLWVIAHLKLKIVAISQHFIDFNMDWTNSMSFEFHFLVLKLYFNQFVWAKMGLFVGFVCKCWFFGALMCGILGFVPYIH